MLYRPALRGNWNALSLARRALKDKFPAATVPLTAVLQNRQVFLPDPVLWCIGTHDLVAACCSKCQYMNTKSRQHHIQEIVMLNSSTICLVASLYTFAQMLSCRGISCAITPVYFSLYVWSFNSYHCDFIPYISSFIHGHNTDCSSVIIMMFWVHFCQQIKSVTSNDYQCWAFWHLIELCFVYI